MISQKSDKTFVPVKRFRTIRKQIQIMYLSSLSQHQVPFCCCWVRNHRITVPKVYRILVQEAGCWKVEVVQSERDVEVGSWKDPGWKVGGSESEAQPHEATQQPEPPSPLDS